MRTAWSAALSVLLLGLVLAPLTVHSAPASQRGRESSCAIVDESGVPYSSRAITPTSILQCERAQVAVNVRVACEASPLHVVLNIDRSGSMVGQPMADAKDAARALVQALDMEPDSSIKVGLISHGDPPTTDVRLTDSPGRVMGRISRLQAGGEDNLPRAVDEARVMLTRERSDTEPFNVMVVLSDGGQTYPPARAVSAAASAKASGILVVSVCLEGFASDCSAVRSMASSTQYYFQARETSKLASIFRQIADQVKELSLRTMTVSETVPEGIAVVPDSVVPTPRWDRTGRTMQWTFRFVPEAGRRYTYSVEPAAVMSYPLAVSTVTFYDSQNRRGVLSVPTAVLDVPAPCFTPATPTPTPEIPTPTPTSTATATPTSTPTPTATATVPPTPTPRPGPAYLPILGLSRCVPADRPVDVVLALDTSSSMRGATSAGRTKFEAARDGARAFVGLMRPIDQAAVLSFDRHVNVATGLTGDRDQLLAAIDGIELASWTRIDLALDAARDELISPRRRLESRAVIVLLTDGQPTHTTTEAVLEAAGRAHAAGLTVFTIGLGPDVDAGLLIEVAGATERYYPAADGEDLLAIYGLISEKIPCD